MTAPVLLYDGACGLCDRFVDFVLRRDRRGVFRFAPLQGATAARLLAGAPEPPGDTVVVADGPRLLVRSRAVLFVLARLPAPWRWLALLRVLPARVLDPLYDALARRRHRLFPRRAACRVPAPDQRARFLD